MFVIRRMLGYKFILLITAMTRSALATYLVHVETGKYLGVDPDDSSKVIFTEERHRAVSILRQQLSADLPHYTILYNEGNGNILLYDNYHGYFFAAASENNISKDQAHLIVFEYPHYKIMSDGKCMAKVGNYLQRLPCNNISQEILFDLEWNLGPNVGTAPNYLIGNIGKESLRPKLNFDGTVIDSFSLPKAMTSMLSMLDPGDQKLITATNGDMRMAIEDIILDRSSNLSNTPGDNAVMLLKVNIN